MSLKDGAVSNEENRTIFTSIAVYFPDANENLKTIEFLDASSGVVTIVEKFGKVFAPVVSDMNGNINKIRKKYEEDSQSHHEIETMILKEQVEGELFATESLIWLKRALHFLSTFFQYIIIDSDTNRNTQDLAPFLKKAYSESLEPYHGWLGSQLFNVLSRFIPSRKNLFYTLALDRHNRDEHVLRDMRIYHQRMMACVARLTEFYAAHGLENL
ncbi:pleckstrin homology domain-containing family A member 8 [Sitophilus oryzae]|uniref:Pleckstrin homology domain-containing family A member 8 n=1 Tax=Sitophilus oryzae TaxID=7048 RepID=A0A6J2YIJ3_SITOR|nr:pleckstrin homology domain-containing family A member 8 [Sitophilus oryzae]